MGWLQKKDYEQLERQSSSRSDNGLPVFEMGGGRLRIHESLNSEGKTSSSVTARFV